MTSPTNHSWSDDSDTTIGPDTFRIGSLNAPKSNLQRSESTLSDSLVYQQQKAQLDNPGWEILRSASPEGSGGYTSLDSPQAKRYHQPHLVDTPKHPLPLSPITTPDLPSWEIETPPSAPVPARVTDPDWDLPRGSDLP